MFMSENSALFIRYFIRHITYSDKEKTAMFHLINKLGTKIFKHETSPLKSRIIN
jgi:hypothetical protein